MIINALKNDKEIQKLRKHLYYITGQDLGFNYDCYSSIDEYREHLKECINAGEIIVREKDKKAFNRFNSIIKK